MPLLHAVVGTILISGLSLGAVAVTPELIHKINAEVNPGVSDSAIQCGLNVMLKDNATLSDVLDITSSDSNPQLKADILACNMNQADITWEQRETATGEPKWLLQELDKQ